MRGPVIIRLAGSQQTLLLAGCGRFVSPFRRIGFGIVLRYRKSHLSTKRQPITHNRTSQTRSCLFQYQIGKPVLARCL